MTHVLSRDPRTADVVEDLGPETTSDDLDSTVRAAADAAPAFDALGPRGRAEALRAVVTALEADREGIVALADRETALGPTRLGGELTRTTYQLGLFAEMLEEGSYLEAVIDHPATTPMGPRPDLRRMLVPLGPVAVFGAGNFPLAFGAPGGDTAAALAAGCPVVLKAHPSHPATYRRVVDVMTAAAEGAGAPAGVLGVVFGQDAGGDLVRYPLITAVGFTGSLRGGRALHDLAAARPQPIPFYGELGSVNPVVVTASAVAARGAEIAAGAVASFTQGNGQFCTKPGLIFVPAGVAGEPMTRVMADAVRAGSASALLDGRVRDGFDAGTLALRSHPAVTVVADAGAATEPADTDVAGDPAEPPRGYAAAPLLLSVPAADLEATLTEECFGPVTLLVTYRDEAELLAAIATLPASLTGTIHAEESDTDLVGHLVDALRPKVGRLLWGGFPTGVAVSWAMQHGGPYPASTSTHTSVGQTSARRFLRPIAYQSAPDALLPPALQEGNPWGIIRRVDGRLEEPR